MCLNYFPHLSVSCSGTFIEKIIFAPSNAFCSLPKICWYLCGLYVGLFLGFCFIGVFYLFIFSNFTQSWLFCLISLFLPSLPLLLDSWGGVDLELGASWMLGKCSATEQNPQPLVVLKDAESLLPPFVSVSVRFLNIYKITCCHLDWVALNLLIVLWWADILTVLTLPVHEYGICLCNSLDTVHVVS